MQSDKPIKDLLLDYLPMAMENRNRLARLNDMWDAAGGLTGIPESDGSAHTARNSHKMEIAVERYLEYEKKIMPILNANTQRMNEIESMVNAIPDYLQREIIRLRYLDADQETYCRQRRWSEVAFCLYGSTERKYMESIQREHRKALEWLERAYVPVCIK